MLKPNQIPSYKEVRSEIENGNYYKLTVDGYEYLIEPLFNNEYHIAKYKDQDLIGMKHYGINFNQAYQAFVTMLAS